MINRMSMSHKISLNLADEMARWGAHVEKERIVSLYQWPQEWGFLVDFYSKMEKALDEHDASVLEEPLAKYDVFAVLDESSRQRYASLKQKFPQTQMRLMGWRIGKPESRLERFKSLVRPVGDIYKTLNWPPGCGA